MALPSPFSSSPETAVTIMLGFQILSQRSLVVSSSDSSSSPIFSVSNIYRFSNFQSIVCVQHCALYIYKLSIFYIFHISPCYHSFPCMCMSVCDRKLHILWLMYSLTIFPSFCSLKMWVIFTFFYRLKKCGEKSL